MKRLTILLLITLLSSAVLAPVSAQEPAKLTLVPFTDETFGFTSVKPEGWITAAPGALKRTKAATDITVLVQQAVPAKSATILKALQPQLGLTEAPLASGTFVGEALTWTWYKIDVTATPVPVTVDLALAESEGKTYIVMVQCVPADYDTLHEGLFLPVLKALAPVKAVAEVVPYKVEEVSVKNGDVTLSGTLTLPEGNGPFPAVILVTGSGPQNRNEELGGIPLQPFKVIADYLTREGIAVLRYDDRGVGKSTGDFDAATTSDFASDARAALDYLLTRNEVAPTRIGVLGHSEGGIVTAMLGASEPRLAFVISLAGTAASGKDVIIAQSEAIARANGAKEADIKETIEALKLVIDKVMSGNDTDLKNTVTDLIKKRVAAMTEEERAQIKDVDKYTELAIQQVMTQYTSPWYRAFLKYDPAEDWAKTTMPVFALFGGKDLQVLVTQNQAPFEAAMKKAGNTKYKVVVFPDANHLFQSANTGSPAEYATLKPEFVPDLLPTIRDWILAQGK